MSNAGMRGWPTGRLTKDQTVVIRCGGTLPMRVRVEVAPLFDELVRRMDARTYPGFMTSSGGYNYRAKRGMEKLWEDTHNPEFLSNHAFGLAGDFRAETNPGYRNRACDFPSDTGTIAAGVGLSWGGLWRNPYDPMHFEFLGTPREAELWCARIAKTKLLQALKESGDVTPEQFNTLDKKLDMILGQLGYSNGAWQTIDTLDGSKRKLSLMDMVRETHRELNMRFNGKVNGAATRATDTLVGHVLNLIRKEGL